MSEEIKITPLMERDTHQTHELLYDILEELHEKDPWALQSYKSQYNWQRMQSLTSEASGSCWVARKGDEIIGFGIGWISGGVGFVNWMGVKVNFRKQGTGSKILERMHQDFTKRRCHKSELYTYQNNETLQSFYKKRGYREIACLDNHYFGLDVVYMLKDLLSVR